MREGEESPVRGIAEALTTTAAQLEGLAREFRLQAGRLGRCAPADESLRAMQELIPRMIQDSSSAGAHLRAMALTAEAIIDRASPSPSGPSLN